MMHSYKLSFLLLLWASFLWGQYLPMPLDSGNWRYTLLSENSDGTYTNSCFNYTALGDTLISGTTYWQIQNEFMGEIGYFQQDSGKVFYTPNPEYYTWNSNLKAFKVYDFNLIAGDSVWLYHFDYEYHDSTKVEIHETSILELEDGITRKVLIIPSGAVLPCRQRWAEGIGQTISLPFYFWPGGNNCFGAGFQITFDCLSIDSLQVYGTCNCGNLVQNSPEIRTEAPRVFPNPSDGIVRVELNEAAPIEISVYNAFGVLKKQEKNVQTLDLKDLPDGIYLLKIDTGNGSHIQKIIKQEN